jgi:hypothetical protein
LASTWRHRAEFYHFSKEERIWFRKKTPVAMLRHSQHQGFCVEPGLRMAHGNGYTVSDRAYELALLRSAEPCLQNGFGISKF